MSTPISLHDALERAKSALTARIDQARQFITKDARLAGDGLVPLLQQAIDNDTAALEVLSHLHVSASQAPVSLSKQDRFVQICADTWNGAYPDRRHWDDIGEEAQAKWIRVFRLHACLIKACQDAKSEKDTLAAALARLLEYGPHVVISDNKDDGTVEISTTQRDTNCIWIDDCAAKGKDVAEVLTALLGAYAERSGGTSAAVTG